MTRTTYPAEAYTPDGQLWWEARVWPGTKRVLGDEARTATWLAYNKVLGDLFTTAEVRAHVTDDEGPNSKEHVQRRLRELRDRDGWDIPSRKYDRSVPQGYYRLDVVGWHLGLGTKRPPAKQITDSIRRKVFGRDGNRCVLCGIGSNEPYPDNPRRKAVLTVGHVVPRSHGGLSGVGNLRTECSICNETARANTARPISLEEFREKVRSLASADKSRLDEWVTQGYRSRSEVDVVFDDFRQLSPKQQEAARTIVARAAGRPTDN